MASGNQDDTHEMGSDSPRCRPTASTTRPATTSARSSKCSVRERAHRDPHADGLAARRVQPIEVAKRLERVIQDFDLYAKERRTQLMEDVVAKMRDDITVQIAKGDDPRWVAWA